MEHAEEEAYKPLAKAYEALAYDAGAVSPAESAKLASLGAAPPSGWVTLDPKEPKAVTLDVPGGKIGVVYFPEAKTPGDDPSEQQIQAIARIIKELRPSVRMVIGVSPWGAQAEGDYLDKHKPDLDILLGAGTSAGGFKAKPSTGGRTLWAHTYTKGKAIYTIDVLAWPGAKGFKWELGTNFTSQAVALDESFAPAPAMEQLLQAVPDPGDKKAK